MKGSINMNIQERANQLIASNLNLNFKVNNISNIYSTLDREYNSPKNVDRVVYEILSTLGKNRKNINLLKECKKSIDNYLNIEYGKGLKNLIGFKFFICSGSFFVRMEFKTWDEKGYYEKYLRIYHNNKINDVYSWDKKYLGSKF